MVESSIWDIFKSHMYINFLKAHKKKNKVGRSNFVSGCSFCYIGHLNWANFDELWTDHICIDRKMNNIYRIYIELSLIWDQSQLSSSIRLEMASKSKWGAPRDPIQFPRDLAERSTNFTRKLRSFRKNRDWVGALNCDAFGIFLQMEALCLHFFRYIFETLCF